MTFNDIFFESAGRLRSGWRFAIFCCGFFFLVTVLSTVGLVLSPVIPIKVAVLLSIVVALIAALFVGWLCGKFLEGLPFTTLGASFTPGWFRHLILGLLAGVGSLGLAVLIAFAFGGLRFEVNAVDTSTIFAALGSSFLLLAAGAASEEALFRGYIFQTFTRSGLAGFAIALTSLFFGAVHLMNPNAGAISTLNTVLAGVWFGVAYLRTRDLWFVFGMHLMWNWMQGAFFGIEISGLTDLSTAPVLKEIDRGPSWLTGTTYGLEGCIAATIALIVSTIGIYLLSPGQRDKALVDRIPTFAESDKDNSPG